jgi:hypothetical protein
MSRAFVRETDLDASDALPERRISAQPNFVTPSGLERIEVHAQQLALKRNAPLATVVELFGRRAEIIALSA